MKTKVGSVNMGDIMEKEIGSALPTSASESINVTPTGVFLEGDIPSEVVKASNAKSAWDCAASLDNGGIVMGARIPDEDLFHEDTERWLAKHMPYLSPEQIDEQLQIIKMMSLLEFYQGVVDTHPELLPTLPKVPKILVARQ